MDFNQRIQPASKQSIFSLEKEGFIVWCGTIAKGQDSNYYLYFSFWPINKGHNGWVTHSKIGYAVADNPLGPFKFRGIALSGAGGDAWDRDCVHNPTVLKVEDTYYLYYMGNYGTGEYWDNRNHQRVGVAYSKHPEGPFQRLDKPIIDVTPGTHDALMTSNPSVAQGPDGRIHMIYKAVSDKGSMPKGGAVVCGMAIADHPLGPFIKSDHPIMVNPENDWSVEDPYIWYEGDRFFALAKDFQGHFTKSERNSVALFESMDSLDWIVSNKALAFKTEILWEDGDIEIMQNMERPQMWLDENGTPSVLCCACARVEDREKIHSFNIQIPIK